MSITAPLTWECKLAQQRRKSANEVVNANHRLSATPQMEGIVATGTALLSSVGQGMELVPHRQSQSLP